MHRDSLSLSQQCKRRRATLYKLYLSGAGTAAITRAQRERERALNMKMVELGLYGPNKLKAEGV